MGRDPKTSVLNRWNQAWDALNLFLTDGACMTTSGNQNPSLTYMALTARACHDAVEELRRGLCESPRYTGSSTTRGSTPPGRP